MSNIRRLRAASMGSISAWLPSRKSTLHQVGAAAMTALGQLLFFRSMGVKARYLVEGLRSFGSLSQGVHWRDSFRSCGRRPIARGELRLAAQQQHKGAEPQRGAGAEDCLAERRMMHT